MLKESVMEVLQEIKDNMMLIPAGSFIVGEEFDPTESADIPRSIKKDSVIEVDSFYMSKFLVTQKQWGSLLEYNISHNKKGGGYPVENISWEHVQHFINMLNNEMGYPYRFRLPTEEEWEYALRGNTTTKYFFGDDESLLPDYAWFGCNSGDKYLPYRSETGRYEWLDKVHGTNNNQTHPVGQKKPNPFGLYDMYGNVNEWGTCPEDNWPRGFSSGWNRRTDGIRRVRTTGCFISKGCSSSNKTGNCIPVTVRSYTLGFRLALDI